MLAVIRNLHTIDFYEPRDIKLLVQQRECKHYKIFCTSVSTRDNALLVAKAKVVIWRCQCYIVCTLPVLLCSCFIKNWAWLNVMFVVTLKENATEPFSLLNYCRRCFRCWEAHRECCVSSDGSYFEGKTSRCNNFINKTPFETSLF